MEEVVLADSGRIFVNASIITSRSTFELILLVCMHSVLWTEHTGVDASPELSRVSHADAFKPFSDVLQGSLSRAVALFLGCARSLVAGAFAVGKRDVGISSSRPARPHFFPVPPLPSGAHAFWSALDWWEGRVVLAKLLRGCSAARPVAPAALAHRSLLDDTVGSRGPPPHRRSIQIATRCPALAHAFRTQARRDGRVPEKDLLHLGPAMT